MAILDKNIDRHGRKVFSQNNEDGIIEYLSNKLAPSPGYFVEIGVGPPSGGALERDGLEANCRLLREKGWAGLFLDGQKYPDSYDVKREFITALNINVLLNKYNCPDDIDVFSIDVDGQDLWIWLSLTRRPKIVVVEFNRDFGPDESFVVPFNVDFRWDCTRYMGASLLAMCKVGESKGYRPVYANHANVFFVREELIENGEDFPYHLRMAKGKIHRDYEGERLWTKI